MHCPGEDTMNRIVTLQKFTSTIIIVPAQARVTVKAILLVRFAPKTFMPIIVS